MERDLPILVIHLIKFVDQTSALICQHQSPSFKGPFASNRVLSNARCETNSTSSLTGRKNGSMSSLLYIFEDLRLCSSRIPEEKDIDVSTNAVFSLSFFADPTEKRKCNSSLDICMAVDTRGHRPNNFIHNLWISGESANLSFIFICKAETSKL